MPDTPHFNLDAFTNHFESEDFTQIEAAELGKKLESQTSDVPTTKARKNGDNLNNLYGQWIAAPSAYKDALTSLLLEDVRLFALLVIRKESAIKSWKVAKTQDQDIAQTAVLKVWSSLPDFKHYSKFSSWVYSIIRNSALDFVRASARRNEVTLSPGTNCDKTPPVKSQGVGPKGRAQLSTYSDSYDEDSGAGGHGVAISKQARENSETGFNAEIDLEAAIQKLNRRDQQLISLIREGYEGKELAKQFNCEPQEIYNRFARIRLLLRHELTIYSTILHTCRLCFESSYELGAGRYVTRDDKTYQVLPEKCRCRKQLTRLESRKLIETGEAQHVFKPNKNGKPVIDSTTIWAAQAPRAPRVGLTSSTHIERAVISRRRQDQSEIEISHWMDVDALRALIVPVKDDPFEGRVRFASYGERRTKHGYADDAYVPSNPRQDPAVMMTAGEPCPKCRKDNLTISIYPDGAIRHECHCMSCRYMAVWKTPEILPKEEKIENIPDEVSNTAVPVVSVLGQISAPALPEGKIEKFQIEVSNALISTVLVIEVAESVTPDPVGQSK